MRRLVGSLAVWWLVAGTAHAQTIVTTCGQTLAGPGALAAGLDCSSFTGDAVVISENTQFDLAGFTLTAGDGHGVRCDKSCRVVSSVPGGVITGATGSGVDGFLSRTRVDVTIDSVRIESNGSGVATGGNVTLTDAEVVGNVGDGVFALALSGPISVLGGGVVKATRSIFNGNGGRGIAADKSAKVTDCDVSGNTGIGLRTIIFSGAATGEVVARDSTFNDNGEEGIYATARAGIKGGGASRNGLSGIRCGPGTDGRCALAAKGATFEDNGSYGVRAQGNIASSRISLRECTISRNARSGAYADGRKRDLVEYGFVKARDSIVQDNGESGLGTEDGKVIAKGCTVTGNALPASCTSSDSSRCFDIDGPDKAVVIDTICDTPVEVCGG